MMASVRSYDLYYLRSLANIIIMVPRPTCAIIIGVFHKEAGQCGSLILELFLSRIFLGLSSSSK